MAIIPQYDNKREFNYTPYARLNKAAGDYTQEGYHNLAKGMDAVSVELKTLQQEEDAVNAHTFAAERSKIAGRYLRKAVDNSANGMLQASKLDKLTEVSKFIDTDELDGVSIHDGMDLINRQFDNHAAETLSKEAYANYKKYTLEASATDSLKAYGIFRGEKKLNQRRFVTENINKVTGSVASADNPIAEGHSAERAINKSTDQASGFTFLSNAWVSKVKSESLKANAETAIEAAIGKGQFNQAAWQLGVSADNLSKLKPDQLKELGVFWDKARLLADDGTDITDAVGIHSTTHKANLSKLEGIKHMDGESKLKLIKKLMAKAKVKAKTDTKLHKVAAMDAINRFATHKHTPEEELKGRKAVLTFAQDHNQPIDARVNAIGEYYMVRNVGNLIQDIPNLPMTATKGANGETPRNVADIRDELIKKMDNIPLKYVFGEALNDPNIKSVVQDPKYATQLKDKILAIFDRQVAKVQAARKKDIAGFTISNSSVASNAYKQLSKAVTSSLETSKKLEQARANKDEETINRITGGKGSTYSPQAHVDAAAKTYVGMLEVEYNNMNIPEGQRKYLPQSVVDDGVLQLNGALKSNDLNSIMRSVDAIKHIYGNNQILKGSFLSQAKKLPPIIDAALRMDDAVLTGQLLQWHTQGKNLVTKDSQITSKLNKAVLNDGSNNWFSTSGVKGLISQIVSNPMMKDRAQYARGVVEAIKSGAYEGLIEGKSVSDAVDASVKKYLPHLGSIVDSRKAGKVILTPDAMRVYNMSQQDAVDSIDTIQSWVEKGKFKPVPTDTVKHDYAKSMFSKEYKDLSPEQKNTVLSEYRQHVKVKVASDGTLLFMNDVTNAPVLIDTGVVAGKIYSMEASFLKLHVTPKDMREMKKEKPSFIPFLGL